VESGWTGFAGYATLAGIPTSLTLGNQGDRYALRRNTRNASARTTVAITFDVDSATDRVRLNQLREPYRANPTGSCRLAFGGVCGGNEATPVGLFGRRSTTLYSRLCHQRRCQISTGAATNPRSASTEEATRLKIPADSIVDVIERVYHSGELAVETADIVIAGPRVRLLYEIPISPRQ
jgi:hypothetical protein